MITPSNNKPRGSFLVHLASLPVPGKIEPRYLASAVSPWNYAASSKCNGQIESIQVIPCPRGEISFVYMKYHIFTIEFKLSR